MQTNEDFLRLESSSRARRAFIAVPILLLIVTAALLGHPATRVQARPWLLYENSPVELLTFGFFLVGGLSGLALAARGLRMGLGALTAAFFALYSLGLIFVAGEEIAWGQWFFHWATPASWSKINAQHETTLHNVSGLNDFIPILHITFALGALIGTRVSSVRLLRWVATPRVLTSWFVLVGVHSTCELVTSALWRNSIIHKLFERTSELNEMYLAIAAWLYVFLNARRVAREAGVAAGHCTKHASAAHSGGAST